MEAINLCPVCLQVAERCPQRIIKDIAWFERPPVIEVPHGAIESDGERVSFPPDSELTLLNGMEAQRLVYVGTLLDHASYMVKPPREARRRQYLMKNDEIELWEKHLYGVEIPRAWTAPHLIVQGALHRADPVMDIYFAPKPATPRSFTHIGTLTMPAGEDTVKGIVAHSDVMKDVQGSAYVLLAYHAVNSGLLHERVYKIYEIATIGNLIEIVGALV